MIFNKYKKKVKNTKREYCDIPEDDNKEKTVLSDVVTNENSFKNIILKNYFKIILKNIYNNFYKNNYFFEIVLYVDIIQMLVLRKIIYMYMYCVYIIYYDMIM